MPSKLLLDAVTATGASEAFDTSGFDTIRVQIWSASSSTSTVLIEQTSGLPGAPWTVSGTLSNPSSTGELWSVPVAGPTRLNVSAYTNGTISGGITAANRRN